MSRFVPFEDEIPGSKNGKKVQDIENLETKQEDPQIPRNVIEKAKYELKSSLEKIEEGFTIAKANNTSNTLNNKDHNDQMRRVIGNYFNNIRETIISKELVIGSSLNEISDVKFSPDGKHFAVICKDSRSLRYYGVSSDKLLWYSEKEMISFQFIRSGEELVALGRDEHLRIFNTVNGEMKTDKINLSSFKARLISINKMETILAVGSDNGTIYLPNWPIKNTSGTLNLAEIKCIQNPNFKSITKLEFNQNGDYLVGALFNERYGGKWIIIDPNTKNILLDTPNRYHIGRIIRISFSPENKYLASLGSGGKIKIFDIKQAKVTHEIVPSSTGKAIDIQFFKNSRHLIVSSSKGNIVLWDLSKKYEDSEYFFVRDPLSSSTLIDISSDGSMIIVSYTNHICLCNMKNRSMIKDYFSGFEKDIDKSLFNSDGSIVLSFLKKDNLIKINDAKTGEEKGILNAVDDNKLNRRFLDFSIQNSKYYELLYRFCVIYENENKHGIVCYEIGNHDKEISFKNTKQIWDQPFDDKVVKVLYNWDGISILILANNGKIYILDSEFGSIRQTYDIKDVKTVHNIIFSQKKDLVLFCGDDEFISFFEITQNEPPIQYNIEKISTNHKKSIINIGLSFDEKSIASMDEAGQIILHDFNKKHEISVFRDSNQKCFSFTKQSDKFIIGGSHLIVYHMETKKILLKIQYNERQIVSYIAISNDGKKMLTAINDQVTFGSKIEIFKTDMSIEDKKFHKDPYFSITKILFNKEEDKYMYINSINQFKVHFSLNNEEILNSSVQLNGNITNFILDENEEKILFIGEFLSLYKLKNFLEIKEIKSKKTELDVTCALFSKRLTGKIIAGNMEGKIYHLNSNLEKEKISQGEDKQQGHIMEILAHPTKDEIFSASFNGNVSVWSETTLNWLRKINMPGHVSSIDCMGLSINGDDLYTGSHRNYYITDCSKENNNNNKKLDEGKELIYGYPLTIKISPRNDLTLCVSSEGDIRIWKNKDYSILSEFNIKNCSICNFNKDGSKILLASGGDIKIITISKELKVEVNDKVTRNFRGVIHALYITPDEKFILAVDDRDLIIMSFDTCKINDRIEIDSILLKPLNLALFQQEPNHYFVLIPLSLGEIWIHEIKYSVLEKKLHINSLKHNLNSIKPSQFDSDNFQAKFLNKSTVLFLSSIILIVEINEKNILKKTINLNIAYNKVSAYDIYQESRIVLNEMDKIHSYYLDKSEGSEVVFKPIELKKSKNSEIDIKTIKFDKEGSKIFLLLQEIISNHDLFWVHVLDSLSGYTIKSHSIKIQSRLFGSFSPNAEYMAFVSDHSLKILDTETFIETLCSNDIVNDTRSIYFTKDSKRIITLSDSTRITILNFENPNLVYDSLKIYEKIKDAQRNIEDSEALELGKLLNRTADVFTLLGRDHPFNIFHLICLYSDNKVLKYFLTKTKEENSDIIYSLLYHKNFLNQNPYQMTITCDNINILGLLIQIHIKLGNQSRYFSSLPFSTETLNDILYYYPNYLLQVIESQLCAWNQRKYINLSHNLEEHIPLEIFNKNELESNITSSIYEKTQPKEQKKMAYLIQEVLISDILLPKNDFLKNLSKSLNENHNIFDSKALSAVLEYKWEIYGKKAFIESIVRYLIYFFLVMISSLILFPLRKFNYLPSDTDGPATDDPKAIVLNPPELKYNQQVVYVASMIFNIACLSYLYLVIVSREIRVILKMKNLNSYFNNGWNLLDIFIIFLGTSTMVFDILMLNQSENPHKNTVLWLKFLFFLNLIITWIRMADFWRGFRKTAALIRLLTRVFSDMKSFFLVLFYLLMGFSMATYLLQNNYETNGKWDFIKMYYNLILGNTDDFDSISKSTSVFEDLYFLTFFLLTVFFIIIMMNLLIAIISDTNSKVTSVEAKAFEFERLNLIIEYEELIDKKDEELLIEKFKGKFLYVFKSSKSILEENAEKEKILDKKYLDEKIKEVINFIKTKQENE